MKCEQMYVGKTASKSRSFREEFSSKDRVLLNRINRIGFKSIRPTLTTFLLIISDILLTDKQIASGGS